MSEIERSGGGEVERHRRFPAFQVAVYGLALVGVWSIVRFVLGTVFSVARIGIVAAVVVLVVLGVRAFLKGPPER
jgi:hypothetical protein